MCTSDNGQKDLDQFAFMEKRRVDRFVEMYKKQHERDPENWPLTMHEEDWNEQYIAWITT